MDIFTTQLTRVVPVPIKSQHLKVKALVKDAAIKKLKEDPYGVEEHDYYVNISKKEEKDSEKNSPEENIEAEKKHMDNASVAEENKPSQENLNKKANKEADKDQDDDTPPHLDIYI